MHAYRVNTTVETTYAVTVVSDTKIEDNMLEALATTILDRREEPQYQALVSRISEVPLIKSVRQLQVNYFNSSVLLKGVYDDVNNTLVLTFRSGRNYRYEGINELCWQELIMAESAGEYYNAFIKKHYK